MEDALPMLRRLQALADEHGVDFGVKLTNTFPVDVAAGELPSQEMYMSGRSLYPLTLSVASRLSHEFGGRLRISYSGGADIFSVKDLFSAGIWPITMATTVLKPGGYERFSQMGEALMDCGCAPWGGVDPAAVDTLLSQALEGERCRKPIKPMPSRKLNAPVPLADCFTAPCREDCPIHQDIPAYLSLVGDGKYEEALEVILQRNPLPFITGTICPTTARTSACGAPMRRAYISVTRSSPPPKGAMTPCCPGSGPRRGVTTGTWPWWAAALPVWRPPSC